MNEFKATFSNMRNTAHDESNLARELRQMENEINRILSTLSIRSSEAAYIRRALRNNIQNVSDARGKLDAMSAALTDIIHLYQSAENKIIGNNPGNLTIKDQIKEDVQNILDKVRDLLNHLGMNLSSAYSKDPVNLSNGNYVYEKVCMELETEMAMPFRIFYNIQDETEGSLGKGWLHTWEVSLERSEERVSMILDDASRYIFVEQNGTYRAAPGTKATLLHQEQGDIVTDKNGISYHFDSSGRLMHMENLIGCAITLEYGEDGLLNRVTDRRGNFYEFSYDNNHHLVKVADSTGRETAMVWNQNQLSMVIDPLGRKTSYHYEEHGWLTEIINGRDISCLVNTFDSQGRTVCQEFADGGRMEYRYQEEDRQVVVTEQNGNEVTYEHDEYLRNTRVIYSDGEEVNTYDENNNRISATDKRGNTSYYSYDARGNMLSFRNALEDEMTFSYNEKNQICQVQLNGVLLQRADYNEQNLQVQTENAIGGIDRYEYDEYGQPVVWERADKSRISMTYDPKGNLASITNAAGGVTRYEYNEQNQVIKTIDPLGNETIYDYNDGDELILVQDAAGNCQTYEYDACGNVVRMTDANGGVTVTEYNKMNKLVRVTEPDGSQTSYEYDTMWNVTAVTKPDGGKTCYGYNKLQRLTTVTDPAGGVNRMEYDACGNLIRREDPDGGIHQLGYDALNRPNYVCDPVGMEVRAEYDALGNVTAVIYPDESAEHYEYDWMSHMIMSQDRSGYQKFYEYDSLGNLKTVSDGMGILEEYSYYPGGLLESEHYADGSSRTFFYDSNENVVRIVNQDGNQWQFTYDCLGRVVCACQENGLTESYEYDGLGNITAVIDGNGVKTSYQYRGQEITAVRDGLGNETYFSYDPCRRLTRVLQPEKRHLDGGEINAFNREQKDIRITDYRYDANGNLVEVTDPEGNQTFYTYNGNNRILSKTDPDGNVTSCQYDADGTVKSYQFADGKSVKMSYNPLKQLIQMEDWLGITKIKPDQMGRPETVTDSENKTISYEWGERGERRSMVYPDGLEISYEYDEAMRLSKCAIGEDTVSYSYYPNGKLKEKKLPEEGSIFYQYNPAGMISQILHKKGGELVDCLTYEYDKNNRKTQIIRKRSGMEDNGIYQYHYNGVGSLTSVWKDGREEEAYRYDAFGNRTFSKAGEREASYAYNRLNQLISMKDKDGEHAFSYDLRGNLVLEQVNGAVARSLQFNAQGLLESVRRAGKTASYQYNGFGDQVRRSVSEEGAAFRETRYLYDITKPANNLLSVEENADIQNMVWDGGILASVGCDDTHYFVNDERMSPLRILKRGAVTASGSFDSFGNILEEKGPGSPYFGYAGCRPDPVSGFAHIGAREYDMKSGRFISKDLIPGMIVLPLTMNAYSYAMGDPINRYDPTGMVVAWLAGGIVGTVANLATKFAGDVVQSVVSGRVQMSSWQSYVGTAAGGFTYGSTFVVSGGNKVIAGAASGAVETFTSEGLSMLTGAEGYRREDGYTWKNLAANTVKGGATGAGSGYLFGKAGDWIKIPGINKGRGSFQAVWKQVMTKAAKGQIVNISWKTIGKGIIAYGGLHLVDQIAQKGWKKIKELAIGRASELALKDLAIGRAGEQAFSWLMKALGGNRGDAFCMAEG